MKSIRISFPQSTCMKNSFNKSYIYNLFDMPFWRLLLAFQIYFGCTGFLETAAQGAGRLCDG